MVHWWLSGAERSEARIETTKFSSNIMFGGYMLVSIRALPYQPAE